MVSNADIKLQVQEFYDHIGWQEASDGFYQNASYEDLRPVTHEYIHKCHLRVLRHIRPSGRFFLDAGSGPIQYPEYLEYSKGYQRRVCADISFVALQEARKRIGEHGYYVVCDIANLPFATGAFDSTVSLHTIHHLPAGEHVKAYQELYRTLASSGKCVIVNGWDNPPVTVFLNIWVKLVEWLYAIFKPQTRKNNTSTTHFPTNDQNPARGTFIRKHNVAWLQKEIGRSMPLSIYCWRSVNVRFLRTFIHPRLAGKLLLKILYLKEELFPHFLGKYGQYPLIELNKPQ